MNGHRPVKVVAASALLLGSLTACDLDDFFGISSGDGKVKLSGQNAFVLLAPEVNSAVPTDLSAVMAVFEGGDNAVLPADAGELLRSTARRRHTIDPESFQLIPPPDVVSGAQPKAGRNINFMSWEAPNLSSLENEFMIARAADIPVRNQENRGTCAAFAALGMMEHVILRDYPEVGTLDLSEQKFYYNSKPECQATGCTPAQGGSSYYNGFNQSLFSTELDIPLESDCPYDGRQTTNELQTPLASGCFRGAVQIDDFETLNSFSEIINALHDGYAVTWASPLSRNWMYPNEYNRNGIITYADSALEGDGRHAAGHAYTIVGYKRLPNMASEGGMCFVVKNSWGAGWGVNGFGCMTLKWMQEWAYENYAPAAIVTGYNVRPGILPDRSEDPSDQPFNNLPDYNDASDETIDRGLNVDPYLIPDADPDDRNWKVARLQGPDGRWYRAQMAEEGSSFALRGLIRETGNPTGTLVIQRSGDNLLMEGEVVGRVSGNTVALCTGNWDPVCGLRIDPRANTLYVEFLYAEYRAVSASALQGGEWKALSALNDAYGLEYYRPQSILDLFTSPVFVRVKADNASSDPIRLALKGLEIKAMGRTVGSFKPGEFGLCTGRYQAACSLYNVDGKLLFLPN